VGLTINLSASQWTLNRGIRMKFIDLQHQYQLIKQDMDAAVLRVLEHGQFIMGPEVREFESLFAEYLGVKHGIAISSGTTALQVALMALDIQPGDEVITTPFSFFATAEVIYLLGAKPIYVDIDPRTFNINPALIEAAVTKQTKAIIPVSLYGQCADMDPINDIAERHGIAVIEDAAQSIGAQYKGRKSGSLTTIACTSFHPAKPLGAYGDAGACLTNDDALAEKMHCILNHGQNGRYNHEMIGINGRCDTLQAAILIQKLKIFNEELRKRQQVAAWYHELFGDDVEAPFVESFNVSSWAQYTIQVDDRDQVQAALRESQIPSMVHYPKGLHEQPIIAKIESQNLQFQHAERAARRVMSLPFYPYMTKDMVHEIVQIIKKVTNEVIV
jgi:UDP-2-acetamido-2-deoxy-ribo-hexuluronate aminotransferase